MNEYRRRPLLPGGEKMSVRTDEGVSDEGVNV